MEPEQFKMPEEIDTSPKKSVLFKVTPLSKYLAMLLFILLPFIGGYVGYLFAPERVVERVIVKTVTVPENDKSKNLDGDIQEETDWLQGTGYDLYLTFEYPADWKITQHGTNSSDEATSAIVIEGTEGIAIFLNGGEAALVEGCDEITFLANKWSPAVERIFNSAKCSSD